MASYSLKTVVCISTELTNCVNVTLRKRLDATYCCIFHCTRSSSGEFVATNVNVEKYVLTCLTHKGHYLQSAAAALPVDCSGDPSLHAVCSNTVHAGYS